MPDLKEFETALIAKLNQGNFDKAFLKSTSAAIVDLKKKGLVIDRVIWKGTPRPDYYIINGIVDPEFWGRFKDINAGGRLRQFEVFPYGILNPEGFKFKASFGI